MKHDNEPTKRLAIRDVPEKACVALKVYAAGNKLTLGQAIAKAIRLLTHTKDTNT